MHDNKTLFDKPLIPSGTVLPEITIRAVVLAVILAVILAAANVYLALKIGTTISASIPASVLALGILRFMRNSNVLESNIVQTAASAGEAMAASAAFILPAFIVLRIWEHFPYWETTLIIVTGGLLGVLVSIPLRRVLLNLPNLRFPEGTAIGKVLRSSVESGGRLKELVYGGLGGAAFSFLQGGLKIASDQIGLWTYMGRSLVGINLGFSSAALAAGYIVGIEVGMSLLLGVIIGWLILVPCIGWYHGVVPAQSAYDTAMDIWSDHLRYVGVGTMLVGGIWTLLKLSRSVVRGIQESLAYVKKRTGGGRGVLPRTERDIPIFWIIIATLILSVLLYVFIIHFMLTDIHAQSGIYYMLFSVFIAVLSVLSIGFILAVVCGYFTGLVGSTNNPLSGVMIMGLLLLSGLYLLLFRQGISMESMKIASMVIMTAAIVAGIASISNENIQDLKAGRMLGATPWKQQLMLALGVVVSAVIVGPVLELLFNAYGMAGVFPRADMSHAQMLGAPQASLMAAVTKGTLSGHLPWDMIGIGAAVAVGIIMLDEFLERYYFQLPVLAVGLGIYLPPEINTPIVIGAVMSYLVKRRTKKLKLRQEMSQETPEESQRGILLACGMVAGSALMGVILAIPFVLMGSSDALAIMPANLTQVAVLIGIIIFALFCYWLYRAGLAKSQE